MNFAVIAALPVFSFSSRENGPLKKPQRLDARPRGGKWVKHDKHELLCWIWAVTMPRENSCKNNLGAENRICLQIIIKVAQIATETNLCQSRTPKSYKATADIKNYMVARQGEPNSQTISNYFKYACSHDVDFLSKIMCLDYQINKDTENNHWIPIRCHDSVLHRSDPWIRCLLW